MPMPLPSNSLLVAEFASALYGVELGSATNAAVAADLQAAAGNYKAVLNGYYQLSFGGMANSAVANIVTTNLGLTGANATAAATFITSQLNTAAAGTQGQTISGILNTFSGLTADATYGSAATAWNATIAASQAYTASGATADQYLNATGAITNYTLTTGADNMKAAAAGSATVPVTFNAPIINNSNTLQSGDVITGAAGSTSTAWNNGTILNATIGNSQAFAMSPTTANVQNFVFHADAVATDSTHNNLSGAFGPGTNAGGLSSGVQIDASNLALPSSGFMSITDSNSRADLLIEDVRLDQWQLDNYQANNGRITKDLAIQMVSTDPGHVDYGIYFDQHSLRNTSSTTGSIVLKMESTFPNAQFNAAAPLSSLGSQAAAGADAGPVYNQVTFVVDGKTQTLTLANMNNVLTYAQLNTALQSALTTAQATNPALKNVVITDNGPGSDTWVSKNNEARSGDTYTVSETGGVVTLPATGGWGILNSTLPNNNSFNAYMTSTPQVTTNTLITSTINLDDVGRGAMGGDLVVGSMATGETSAIAQQAVAGNGAYQTVQGVQQFNITVGGLVAGNQTSALQHIASTNNTLQVVNITNAAGTQDNLIVRGDLLNAAPAVAGGTNGGTGANLASGNPAGAGANGTGGSQANNGGNNGNASNVNTNNIPVNSMLPGLSTNNGGNQGGSFGFSDVQTINASTFAGKLNFNAEITPLSFAKYLTSTTLGAPNVPFSPALGSTTVLNNSQPSPTADTVPFVYSLGTNDSTMVVQIDGTVAGSNSKVASGREDFSFTFNASPTTGNDNITVGMVNSNSLANNHMNGGINPAGTVAEAWYQNQKLNANVTINAAGSGNDTINKPGAGDAIINLGGSTGNDTVYADNTGTLGATAVGQGPVASALNVAAPKAVWVFNTANQYNVNTGVAAATYNPATMDQRNLADLRSDSNNQYQVFGETVTVKYKDISTQVPVTVANTGYMTSDLQINQAIKAAINNDPVLSKLLLAQDGPANTLVVTSLIDGAQANNDLSVTLANSFASGASISAADITGATAAWGLATDTTGTTVFNNITAQNTAFNTKADYVAQLAETGAQGTAANVQTTGANSNAVSDNTITVGKGTDVLVLGTTGDQYSYITNTNGFAAYPTQAAALAAKTAAGGDVTSSMDVSNDTVVFNGAFGNPTNGAGVTIVHFKPGVAVLGGDVLNMVGEGGNVAGNMTQTALNLTSTGITVQPLVTTGAGANNSAAAVTALYNAQGNLLQGTSHVDIVYAGSNIATVYQVTGSAGAVTATAQGTIDLADTNWNTLTTDNFTTVSGTGTNSGASTANIITGTGVAPVVPPVAPPAGAPGTTTVAVNATGNTVEAAAPALYQYNLAQAASYTYSVTGFHTGDKIVGIAGVTPSVVNTGVAAANGTYTVGLSYATPQGTVDVIQLVGLTQAQDAALFNGAAFNTLFGAGTLA